MRLNQSHLAACNKPAERDIDRKVELFESAAIKLLNIAICAAMFMTLTVGLLLAALS